jgi:hypothetical protein
MTRPRSAEVVDDDKPTLTATNAMPLTAPNPSTRMSKVV